MFNSCIIAHRPKALNSSLQDISRLFIRTKNKVPVFSSVHGHFQLAVTDCGAQEEECWCHAAGTAAPLWQAFVLKRLPSRSNSLTNMETSKDSCSLSVLPSAWPRPWMDLLRSSSLLVDLIKLRDVGDLLLLLCKMHTGTKKTKALTPHYL